MTTTTNAAGPQISEKTIPVWGGRIKMRVHLAARSPSPPRRVVDVSSGRERAHLIEHERGEFPGVGARRIVLQGRIERHDVERRVRRHAAGEAGLVVYGDLIARLGPLTASGVHGLRPGRTRRAIRPASVSAPVAA